MSDGAPPPGDAAAPGPDDLDRLDEAETARFAARVWDRLIGRNPDLRDETDD